MRCLLRLLRLAPVCRTTPLIPVDAPCGSAISRRLGIVRERPLRSPCAKLHAAKGETDRTVRVALRVHVATADIQVRAAHTRGRERRTAPHETALAHNVQGAGTAVAVTRSRVEVGGARSYGSVIELPAVGESSANIEVGSGSSVALILSEDTPKARALQLAACGKTAPPAWRVAAESPSREDAGTI